MTNPQVMINGEWVDAYTYAADSPEAGLFRDPWDHYSNVPVGDYARRVLLGGRGYGKNSFRKRWLNSLVEERERERDTYAPGLGTVRWACAKPSEWTPPVTYAPGSYGWMAEERERRMRASGEWDFIMERNRKVHKENIALYERTKNFLWGE